MELIAENVKNIRSLALCKEFLRQAIEQNDRQAKEIAKLKEQVALLQAEFVPTNGEDR